MCAGGAGADSRKTWSQTVAENIKSMKMVDGKWVKAPATSAASPLVGAEPVRNEKDQAAVNSGKQSAQHEEKIKQQFNTVLERNQSLGNGTEEEVEDKQRGRGAMGRFGYRRSARRTLLSSFDD